MILTAFLAGVAVTMLLIVAALAVIVTFPEWFDHSPARHRLEDRRVPEVTT